MKKIDRRVEAVLTGCYVALVSAIAILFLCLTGTISANANHAEPITYIQEQPYTEGFDTSILEQNWWGGFPDGQVRMVGAWWYAIGVVEDEQGQLWGIDQEIDTQDFLLLWIADNHTPEDVTDDIVVKVWREAY